MARSAAQADAGRGEAAEPVIGGDEPLADWERELYSGDAAATTPAPAGGEDAQSIGVDTAASTEGEDSAQA
jgi:hypothetical protein